MNKIQIGRKLRELGYEPHERGEPGLDWTGKGKYLVGKGDEVWMFNSLKEIGVWLDEKANQGGDK